MDGTQTAARIREIFPEIPLIAITSDDQSDTELYQAGFNEIVIKPFHGTKIIELIQSYLNKV